MKKILAFLLSILMVMSIGVTSFSAIETDLSEGTQAGSTFDEATFDEASKDEASKDEASKDELPKDEISKNEASEDQATYDEATFDEAYLRSLVLEFILNSVHVDIDLFADVEYSLDMIITHKSEATSDYAVFDLNFVCNHNQDEEYVIEHGLCEHGYAYLNIGDVIYKNGVNDWVSCFLGLGLYVVIPETRQVMLLEDALDINLENLKELCIENGLGRRIGDADGDGELTVRDATYIQKVIADLAENNFYEGWGYISVGYTNIYDFDGNRKVDVRDATNLQKSLADLSFSFDGNSHINTTTIPETAEKLECRIVRAYGVWDWDREEEMSDYVKLFTSVDEYVAASLDESGSYDDDVFYNEEYFENNYLVFVHRIFGSGSFGYRVRGVYVQGDTLYIDTCVLDVTPGCCITDDMNYIGIYIEIPKSEAPDAVKVVKFTDTCYFY